MHDKDVESRAKHTGVMMPYMMPMHDLTGSWKGTCLTTTSHISFLRTRLHSIDMIIPILMVEKSPWVSPWVQAGPLMDMSSPVGESLGPGRTSDGHHP